MKRYIRSKRGAKTINIVFGLIIALVLLGIMIYVVINWVIPLFSSSVSCESSGGYWFEGKKCPKDEFGERQPLLKGLQGSPGEGHICCFGEELDVEEEDDDVVGDGSSGICEDKELCYSHSGDGVSSLQIMNKYTGDCLALHPEDDPKNGEVLPKKGITFSSTVDDAECCVMQLGGITDNDTKYYFKDKSPASRSGFKREFSGAEDGECKVELSFDFSKINDGAGIFDYDKWKDTNMAWSDCNDAKRPKAMFKLDVMYWDEECTKVKEQSSKVIPNSAPGYQGGYSTLIDIKELDVNNVVYDPEETGGGSGTGTQHYIFQKKTRKSISSSDVGGTHFESVVNSLYSTGSDLRADVCEIYCADEVGNLCNDVKVTYSTDRQHSCDPQLYNNPDVIFIDGGSSVKYSKVFNTPTQERKFCIAYRVSEGDSYRYDSIISECNSLVFINDNIGSYPDLPCDKGVDSCGDVKNEYICEEGEFFFGTEKDAVDDSFIHFYPDSYCDSELYECYYDDKNDQCLSCSGMSGCTGYSNRQTCEENPCELTYPMLHNVEKECFWDSTEGDCFDCPSDLRLSCDTYESRSACESNPCGLLPDCYWETGFGFFYGNRCLNYDCHNFDGNINACMSHSCYYNTETNKCNNYQ